MSPAQITAWDLDQATIDNLTDYFYYREIFDDEKMYRIFTRTINILRDKYKSMIRVESISFDPLVSKYFELESIITKDGIKHKVNEGKNTITHRLGDTTHTWGEYNIDDTIIDDGDDSSELEGRNGEKITDDGSFSKNAYGSKSENTHGSSSNSGSSSSTGNIHTSDTNHTTDQKTTITTGNDSEIDRNAVKAAPMNASGVTIGAKTGKLGGLDFSYASSYGQNDITKEDYEKVEGGGKTDVTSSGSSSNSTNGYSSNSGQTSGSLSGSDSKNESGSNDNTRIGSYTDWHLTQNGHYNETKEDAHNTDDHYTERSGANVDETQLDGQERNDSKENVVQHDRYAGRDGVLPQDAMAAATHYLMTYSTAFQWLCNKLELCFIGIYDI